MNRFLLLKRSSSFTHLRIQICIFAQLTTSSSNRCLWTKSQKDYYEMLEVSRESTTEEIKLAYYRLAKSCHPDLNPNDMSAKERFQALSEAYEVDCGYKNQTKSNHSIIHTCKIQTLSDQSKRHIYHFENMPQRQDPFDREVYRRRKEYETNGKDENQRQQEPSSKGNRWEKLKKNVLTDDLFVLRCVRYFLLYKFIVLFVWS